MTREKSWDARYDQGANRVVANCAQGAVAVLYCLGMFGPGDRARGAWSADVVQADEVTVTWTSYRIYPFIRRSNAN